jgi:hypothetical protein
VRLLTPAVGLALATLAAAPAGAFNGTVTKHGDLDGDGHDETVRSVRVDLAGVEDMFDQTKVQVQDDCDGGIVKRNVAGPQDNLESLRLRRLDTHKGREIFTSLRSGASARQGEARVVGWRRVVGSNCGRPRKLFRYRSTHPTAAPSGSTGEVSSFNVSLKNRTKRYRGIEVRLAEGFLKKGEPECCPSIKKVSLYRYSRKRDRYVRYAKKVAYTG